MPFFLSGIIKNPDDSFDCGLLLAGTSDSSDNRLTVEDVRKLDLRGTRLIVLAACKSGLDVSGSGDRISTSLAHAFIAAGADCVLATLWDVSDDVCPKFSESFYLTLDKGGDVGAALHDAQMAIRGVTKDISAWGAYHIFR